MILIKGNTNENKTKIRAYETPPIEIYKRVKRLNDKKENEITCIEDT